MSGRADTLGQIRRVWRFGDDSPSILLDQAFRRGPGLFRPARPGHAAGQAGPAARVPAGRRFRTSSSAAFGLRAQAAIWRLDRGDPAGIVRQLGKRTGSPPGGDSGFVRSAMHLVREPGPRRAVSVRSGQRTQSGFAHRAVRHILAHRVIEPRPGASDLRRLFAPAPGKRAAKSRNAAARAVSSRCHHASSYTLRQVARRAVEPSGTGSSSSRRKAGSRVGLISGCRNRTGW